MKVLMNVRFLYKCLTLDFLLIYNLKFYYYINFLSVLIYLKSRQQAA